MKFSIKDFFSKETADMVTFTEEILNGKLHFLWSGRKVTEKVLIKNVDKNLPIENDSKHYQKSST